MKNRHDFFDFVASSGTFRAPMPHTDTVARTRTHAIHGAHTQIGVGNEALSAAQHHILLSYLYLHI